MKRFLSTLLILMLFPLCGTSAVTTLEDLANEYRAIPIPELGSIIGVVPEDRGLIIANDDLRGQGYVFPTPDSAAFVRQFEAMLSNAFTATDYDLQGSAARLYTHSTGARLLLAPVMLKGHVLLMLEDGYT